MDIERIASVPPAVDEAAVMEEVASWLADEPLPERRPWQIENIGQADWAIRAVGEIRAREQEYDDQIALWADAKRRMGAAAEWFEERLKEWAVALRTDRNKSQQLAHGTVQTTAVRPRIEIVDVDAVTEWAKGKAPQAVHIEVAFRKSEVGAAWRIGGRVVGFEAIDKETGEVEELSVDQVQFSIPADPGEALAVLSERMPGHSVSVLTETVVVDVDGVPVPGVEVVPGRVSATVRPLMGLRR